MPGLLKPGLRCPVCGRDVLCVFHAWSGTHDTATFEYHHKDDPERAEPSPCTVVLPYKEGLARERAEAA